MDRLHRYNRLPVIRHLTMRPRLALVTVGGILLWALLPYGSRNVTRMLISWDFAVGLYLVLVAVMMTQSDTDKIRRACGGGG